MVKNGIGICHAIHRYAKANNKYKKKYDKNKEFSFIEYLDVKMYKQIKIVKIK